jgi:hypothetical protein
VLAHLVFWHETYVGIIRALVEGRQPRLATGTFKDLNAHAVRELESETIPRLLERLARAQARLRTLYGPARAGDVALSFRVGSKQWPIDEAVDKIAGHTRGHGLRIQHSKAAG